MTCSIAVRRGTPCGFWNTQQMRPVASLSIVPSSGSIHPASRLEEGALAGTRGAGQRIRSVGAERELEISEQPGALAEAVA